MSGPDVRAALGRATGRLDGLGLGGPGLDRSVLAGAAGLFALFLLLEPLLYGAVDLPRAVYDAPSLLVAAFGRSWGYGAGWGLSVLALLTAPRQGWWRLPREARWLWAPTALAVLAVAWHLATLDANWMLGRAFGVDRTLLAALSLACLAHPAALAAFVVSALAFTGQLHVAPFRFGWIDTNVLHHVLLVVFLWTGLRELSLRWRGRPVAVPAASAWAVLMGVLGAWYLLPAVGKLRLGWIWENDLSHIFRAAYEQHGWLAALGPERHAALAGLIERLALPMQMGALLTEGLVLLFFWSRRVTLALLAACLALHALIFATTGVFFWKWAALLVALVAVFGWMGESEWKRLFPRWTMLTACGGVMLTYTLLGLLVLPRPSILAWYDAPLVYRFRVEAGGASGQRYEVTPAAFAPFDSRFAQGRFYYLTETPRLVDCYGGTWRRGVYRKLCRARTPEEVRAIAARLGERRASPEQRAELETALRRYLDATHARAADPPLSASPLKAPLHIWTGQRHDARLPAYAFQEPLERLEMTLVERHLQDGRYVVITDEPVLAVER